MFFIRQFNAEEESAWGDEEPTYYNEGAEIENIRKDSSASTSSQPLPPPIPPLPDHYSARPSNLPLPAEGFQSNDKPVASPLYENTGKNVPDNTYSLADDEALQPRDNSPRHESWFHGKLSRNAVSTFFYLRSSLKPIQQLTFSSYSMP